MTTMQPIFSRRKPYQGPSGDTIRNVRKMHSLTQDQLAAECGVSRISVSRWENGRARPSRAAVLLIQALQRQLLFGDQL